jgi:hypothetical protein
MLALSSFDARGAEAGFAVFAFTVSAFAVLLFSLVWSDVMCTASGLS